MCQAFKTLTLGLGFGDNWQHLPREGRCCLCESDPAGGAVGTDQTASAARAGEAQRRPATRPRQGMPHGYPVCAAHGHPVGVPAAGDGLWKWGNLLEAPQRLAQGWGLEEEPQGPPGQARRGGQDRLAAGADGFLFGGGRFFGGAKAGPNPTDRATAGSKRHVLTDGRVVPLAIELTGANTHDSQPALALVDSVHPIRCARGRPGKRPKALAADKAYDSAQIRVGLRRRGIRPIVPMRYEEGNRGIGKIRWVVEHTVAWLNQLGRLRIRYERRPEIHEALLLLGCAPICWNFLQPGF